jgi:hypothetical protein
MWSISAGVIDHDSAAARSFTLATERFWELRGATFCLVSSASVGASAPHASRFGTSSCDLMMVGCSRLCYSSR